MLAALLIAFFLGGSVGAGALLTQDMLEDFDRRAQQVVADPARAEAITREVAALSTELKHFDKALAKSSKALNALYTDHSAGASSVQAELDALNSAWEAGQANVLDHRFNIREQMTQEEWASTFRRD